MTTKGNSWSAKHTRASNAVGKSGVITTQYDPETGHEIFFVRGKYSPAVNELANEIGAQEAIEFLYDEGAPVSASTLDWVNNL